jgi:hypothetical protein
MSQNLLEKLELRDEKNILVQGLPSSVEKHFLKINFAKNVTPLLKSRKVDFALVFALNVNQLQSIMKDVLPVLQEQSKCWIAIPKSSSKIATDLYKRCNWICMEEAGYESGDEVSLDSVWTALRFSKKSSVIESVHSDMALA